jgi:hypothetical protein
MIVVIRNQVEGLLEQGGIKLTAVASDPFGVSGGAMRQLIAKGETNATVLADQAHGRLRKKEEQLKEALAGRLDGGYRFLWKQRLEQVELLRRQISELNAELARTRQQHVAILRRLSQIPGVDRYAAQELLVETGPRAAGAVAHRIGKVVWLILHEGVEYQEKGIAPLSPEVLKRKLRHLVKEFAKAGIDVRAALAQALVTTC